MLLGRFLLRSRSAEPRPRVGLRAFCGLRALLGLFLARPERAQSRGFPHPVSLGLLEVLDAGRTCHEALSLAVALRTECTLGSLPLLPRRAHGCRLRLALPRRCPVGKRSVFDALSAEPEQRGERITAGHARQGSAD
jgi:hypothetical protein